MGLSNLFKTSEIFTVETDSSEEKIKEKLRHCFYEKDGRLYNMRLEGSINSNNFAFEKFYISHYKTYFSIFLLFIRNHIIKGKIHDKNIGKSVEIYIEANSNCLKWYMLLFALILFPIYSNSSLPVIAASSVIAVLLLIFLYFIFKSRNEKDIIKMKKMLTEIITC